MAANHPLDTTIAVVTPENIAFEYQLAGPFRRLPAYLIDIAVRWAVIILVMIALMMAGGMLGIFSRVMGSTLEAVAVILLFLISWFYGTTMEAYFNGRTVGKWACGIRVIDVEGRPVTGRSALLRNLIRIADMMPIAAISQISDEIPPFFLVTTGMIGLSSMVFTKRMQRLGDLAAGTMVIVDERAWRLPVAKVDDPRVPALSSFFPGDYRVSRTMARTLAVYAERRHYLTPARRREIARHLTDPLISRFEFRHDIDPDLLLYSLYYKTFLAESNAEPPDLGPLRGYSPLTRDANKPTANMQSTLPTSPIDPAAAATTKLQGAQLGDGRPVTLQSPIREGIRPAAASVANTSAPQTGSNTASDVASNVSPPSAKPNAESDQAANHTADAKDLNTDSASGDAV